MSIAAEVREGFLFDKWVGQTAQVANVNLAATTITMPAADVRIRAAYRTQPEDAFSLTVHDGEGAGTFSPATFQTITGKPAEANQIFARWVGQVGNLEDVNLAETRVYMPAHDLEVRATYASFFTVSTQAGEGGTLSPGSRDVVENERTAFAVAPADGYRIAEVSGCNGARSGTTYTTGLITAPCTVNATFVADPAPEPETIPTLSEWAMILLTVLLLALGAGCLRRRGIGSGRLA